LVFAELVKRSPEQNEPEFRLETSLRQLVRHHEARKNGLIEAGFTDKKGYVLVARVLVQLLNAQAVEQRFQCLLNLFKQRPWLPCLSWNRDIHFRRGRGVK
jgi:hypothetical protein